MLNLWDVIIITDNFCNVKNFVFAEKVAFFRPPYPSLVCGKILRAHKQRSRRLGGDELGPHTRVVNRAGIFGSGSGLTLIKTSDLFWAGIQ